MSLFESVGKKLLGSLLGGQSGAGADAGGSLVDNIMQMVNEAGGIQAVLQKFQEAGFGQQVASWLGQGSNLPISGDQTQQALGGLLSHLSQRTGLSESMLAEGVANCCQAWWTNFHLRARWRTVRRCRASFRKC